MKTPNQCHFCEADIPNSNQNNPKSRKVCLKCEAQRIDMPPTYCGQVRSLWGYVSMRITNHSCPGGSRAALSVEDVLNVWPEDGICPATGLRLALLSKGRDQSPNIDRIDPTKGYTPDNIQVISGLGNRMKSNATKAQLDIFAKWVLNSK